jgi:hypothetical protein
VQGGRQCSGPGDGVTGPGRARGAHRCGLKEDDIVAGLGTALWTWGGRLCGQRRHGLRSGKIRHLRASTVVRNDDVEVLGRTRRCHEGSGEDVMMAQRLWGGRRRRRLQGNFQREILAA